MPTTGLVHVAHRDLVAHLVGGGARGSGVGEPGVERVERFAAPAEAEGLFVEMVGEKARRGGDRVAAKPTG